MRNVHHARCFRWINSCLLLLLFCCAPVLQAQTKLVKAIEIESVWNGLGPFSTSKLTIRRKGDGFSREGKEVNVALVERLLCEIEQPADTVTIESLGITESWLRDTARDALPDRLKQAEENEKNLFLTSYRNINLIEKLLPRIARGGWTDDYPSFTLRIVEANGPGAIIGSDRQNIFMLPLTINVGGTVRYSYNAKLSRTIAALLPDDFTNRRRLAGEHLRHVLTESVLGEIEDELKLLETKNKLGAELQQLEGRYTLKKTSIGYISSVDVETLGEKYPRWNAELYRADLPQNIFIGLSLPYESSRLKNFALFLGKIDSLVGQTLSVPWLSKYLSERPDTTAEVRFVTDRSLSPKAFNYFMETMRALGAEGLVKEMQGRLGEGVFLQIDEPGGWSRWIVLPDRRMILFDFQGDNVLKWRVADFTTRVRYDSKHWHMAKALISPEGEIISK